MNGLGSFMFTCRNNGDWAYTGRVEEGGQVRFFVFSRIP
jgi:hypothetical protein